ncbi:MAG: DNA-methyltransferase [Burkholderiales bacterium]
MANEKRTSDGNLASKRSIASEYSAEHQAVFHQGDCVQFMRGMPDESVQLVVTSPPYNLGKKYEKRGDLETYLAWQQDVIDECVRILSPRGSICWQVGNYVSNGAIVPLDIALYPAFAKHGLKLRNRIVWHFEHGLHCSRRLSGRYETIMWFTKSDDYTFNLNPIRVPQKYPGKKYFKGPKAGQLSGNPLGKNPGDVWIFPNVKNNHVEKTSHPCQFPIELAERLLLSLTMPHDLVFDPFAGVGTSVAAALRNKRRGCGVEKMPEYVKIARQRLAQAIEGSLPVREMNTPVYDPQKAGNSLTKNPWRQAPIEREQSDHGVQYRLLQERRPYAGKA